MIIVFSAIVSVPYSLIFHFLFELSSFRLFCSFFHVCLWSPKIASLIRRISSEIGDERSRCTEVVSSLVLCVTKCGTMKKPERCIQSTLFFVWSSLSTYHSSQRISTWRTEPSCIDWTGGRIWVHVGWQTHAASWSTIATTWTSMRLMDADIRWRNWYPYPSPFSRCCSKACNTTHTRHTVTRLLCLVREPETRGDFSYRQEITHHHHQSHPII